MVSAPVTVLLHPKDIPPVSYVSYPCVCVVLLGPGGTQVQEHFRLRCQNHEARGTCCVSYSYAQVHHTNREINTNMHALSIK